jgi:hypothetical protein
MKIPTLPSSALVLTALALAACGGAPHETDLEDEAIVLSLAQAPTNAEQADVWQQLEMCAPTPELETHQGEGDLRLADVALASYDGQATVEVTLANVAPVMALGYPSALVEVIGGDALVGTSPFEPSAEANWVLYGLEACSTFTAPIALTWGDDAEAKLRVRAMSGYQQVDGETEWESMIVTVRRD